MAKGQANAHLYRFATSNGLLYPFLYGMFFCPLSPQLVTTQQLLSLLSHALSRRLSNAEETWAFNSTCALLHVLFSSSGLERATLTEAKPFCTITVWGNQIPLRLLSCSSLQRQPWARHRPEKRDNAFLRFLAIHLMCVDSQRSCCSTLERQVPVPQQMTKRWSYYLLPPRKYSDDVQLFISF